MLHALRQQRHTLGRSIATMLVTVWLALAFQPCVMAADALLAQTAHAAMDADCVQQEPMRGGDDCQLGMTCLSMLDPGAVDVAGMNLPAQQPVLVGWVTSVHSPITKYPAATHFQIAFNLPPLQRFCVLQV